jgi:hypothetical protein
VVVRYATRDDVLVALDLPESARLSAAVDRALDAASRAVETTCAGRYFHPPSARGTWCWPRRAARIGH